jgi:hypothetical protein
MLSGIRRSVALAFLALAATACESMEMTGTSPTALRGPVAVNRGGLAGPDLFAVDPAFLVPTRVAQPVCPAVPPFAANFVLLVRGDGRLDSTLTQIRMTFVDRSGMAAPAITLPNTILTREFGSLSIPAGGARRFPLTATFGCATAPFGSLHIVVFTQTSDGRIGSGGLTVPVN